jgi:hypothetical protein
MEVILVDVFHVVKCGQQAETFRDVFAAEVSLDSKQSFEASLMSSCLSHIEYIWCNEQNTMPNRITSSVYWIAWNGLDGHSCDPRAEKRYQASREPGFRCGKFSICPHTHLDLAPESLFLRNMKSLEKRGWVDKMEVRLIMDHVDSPPAYSEREEAGRKGIF